MAKAYWIVLMKPFELIKNVLSGIKERWNREDTDRGPTVYIPIFGPPSMVARTPGGPSRKDAETFAKKFAEQTNSEASSM